MSKSSSALSDDRARLALEQALLLVDHLERAYEPDFRFVRAHALTLLQLVDGIDDQGLPRAS
jgi:hypothetical protein